MLILILILTHSILDVNFYKLNTYDTFNFLTYIVVAVKILHKYHGDWIKDYIPTSFHWIKD